MLKESFPARDLRRAGGLAMSRVDALSDDDFLDAPPGFRSEAHKTRASTWIGMTAAVYFLVQMVLPQVINFTMMPGFVGRPFGMQFPNFAIAAVHDERLWYVIFDAMAGPSASSKLKSMTLDGQSEGRELSVGFDVKGLASLDGALWAVGNSQVAMIVEGSPVVIHPARSLVQPSAPFRWGTELGVIDRDDQGRFTLLRLSDGEWLDRGEIVWPGEEDRPADALEPETGPPSARELAMRNYSQSASGASERHLWVVGDGEQGYLFAAEGPNLAGSPFVGRFTSLSYGARYWFRPSRLDDGDPSAWIELRLHPNPATAAIGDIPPAFALLDGELTMIRLVNDSTSSSTGTLEALHVDEATAEVTSFAKLPISGASSVRGLADTEADRIVVVCDTLTGGAELRRLHSTGFDEIRAKNSGMLGELFRQYWPAYLALAFATIVPMLIFVVTSDVLMRKARTFLTRRGKRTVRQSTLLRRGVARFIDGIVFSLPTTVAMWAYFWTLDLNDLVARFRNDWAPVVIEFAWFFGILTAVGFGILIVMAILEGYWGISPGKWICGLRVIRKTTLKPPGFLRAMARLILLIADSMFNYIPAVVLIGLTADQQRIGDFAADTIVVTADSYRASQPEAISFA